MKSSGKSLKIHEKNRLLILALLQHSHQTLRSKSDVLFFQNKNLYFIFSETTIAVFRQMKSKAMQQQNIRSNNNKNSQYQIYKLILNGKCWIKLRMLPSRRKFEA